MSAINYDPFYRQFNDWIDKIINSMQKLNNIEILNPSGSLINIDNEIINIKKVQDKLNLAKSTKSHKIIDIFYDGFVHRFANAIVLRDEQYFIDRPPVIDEDVNSSVNSNIIIIASHFDKETKNNMWDHLNLLCFITEKVLGGNRNVFANARRSPHLYENFQALSPTSNTYVRELRDIDFTL